jgi:hypothetical protein
MTEQPPASEEALRFAARHSADEITIYEMALDIDAICEQRVSAETERCAQIAHRHRPAVAGWALDATETIEREIRAPAERPAPALSAPSDRASTGEHPDCGALVAEKCRQAARDAALAKLARLREPDVRAAVIKTIIAKGKEKHLYLAGIEAAPLADAALAVITEKLK